MITYKRIPEDVTKCHSPWLIEIDKLNKHHVQLYTLSVSWSKTLMFILLKAELRSSKTRATQSPSHIPLKTKSVRSMSVVSQEWNFIYTDWHVSSWFVILKWSGSWVETFVFHFTEKWQLRHRSILLRLFLFKEAFLRKGCDKGMPEIRSQTFF
jgi:hypothetical protein